ncbi:transketolase family protein [Treponema primitia]|uniref:transketolase family protein n=1 Tax=Treponema primitia TaxID=88058 RepID=UPI0039803076
MGEKKSTRAAYGDALCEFGGNTKIVALDADLASCTMSEVFGAKYPERFFNVGIAEANMIDMAAGFATTGKIAFCHSFAMFTAGRGYDQIRNSVAYPHLNVKVIGSHAGLTVGEDGATHQCIEDLSLMRTIPGMVVLAPCDAHETREAVKAIISYEGPCFMRTGRTALETVTDTIPGYSFTLGKGVLLRDGKDVTIIATGLMVQESLKAAELLEKEGVHARIIDMHTIKPIDAELILKAASETGAIVTAEEHNIIGGLGSAVCEVVSAEHPIPVVRVGVNDVFGRSGDAKALLIQYGLSPENLVKQAKIAISKKK